MTRKLIIHIETDEISDADALWRVLCVARGGRISESRGRKHYCWLSTFNTEGTKTVSATKRTDTTDTFYVR